MDLSGGSHRRIDVKCASCEISKKTRKGKKKRKISVCTQLRSSLACISISGHGRAATDTLRSRTVKSHTRKLRTSPRNTAALINGPQLSNTRSFLGWRYKQEEEVRGSGRSDGFAGYHGFELNTSGNVRISEELEV